MIHANAYMLMYVYIYICNPIPHIDSHHIYIHIYIYIYIYIHILIHIFALKLPHPSTSHLHTNDSFFTTDLPADPCGRTPLLYWQSFGLIRLELYVCMYVRVHVCTGICMHMYMRAITGWSSMCACM